MNIMILNKKIKLINKKLKNQKLKLNSYSKILINQMQLFNPKDKDQ